MDNQNCAAQSRLLRFAFFLLAFAAFLFAAPSQAAFTKAQLQGKVPLFCQAGETWDPRNGGECWACPAGFVRTLYPVTNAKACTQWAAERLSKANYHHRTGCSSGEFFDPRGGGECWQCPAGFPRRTLYAVTDPKACATAHLIGERLSPATFKGKVGKCTAGQFFDPRNGGECWSCPNATPRRTLHPVTADAACAQKELPSPAGEKLAAAVFRTKSRPFSCPAGQFWDPRNGGECWSCPASHQFRTINPVNHEHACSNNFGEIFALDPQLICRGVVSALAAAYNGAQDAQAKMDEQLHGVSDALAPILKPIENALNEINRTVTDATKLDVLLKEVAKRVQNQPIEHTLQAGQLLASKEREVIGLLLNDKLVCSGQGAGLSNGLKSLGLVPAQKKASASDFLISSANALPVKRGDRFMASFGVSAAGTMKSPPIGLSIGLSFMTDGARMHGLYLSFSPQVSSSRNNIGLGVNTMVFPATQLGAFDGTAIVPSIGLSISAGKKLDDFFTRFGKSGLAGKPIPDTLDLSLDLLALSGGSSTPFGIGVSKSWDFTKLLGHEGKGLKFVDFTGSASWSVPLWLQLQ